MTEFFEQQLKVLLVDDSEDDYYLTRLAVGEIKNWNVDLEWAPTYKAAVEVIEKGNYDACLIDYQLGPDSGLELIAELVKDGCQTPLILLTGKGDRDVDIEAMNLGAADYLVKDQIEAYLLERSIRYSIQRRKSEEAREKLERQLFEAQKLESIGKLAGGVAHQFNNILTPIVGYAQQLMDQLPEAHQWYHKLEAIDSAAVRASKLVNQLLTFSRGMPAESARVAIDELIVDAGNAYKPLLGENFELVIVPGSPGRDVIADPGQILKVLLNLIVNARDAMPDGGRITIETSYLGCGQSVPPQLAGGRPTDLVLLSISDTGHGIAEDVKNHLFEPFFITKGDSGGTGLNLAECHGIVNQMGGHIEVESELGKGTCFRIFLPLAVDTSLTPYHTGSRGTSVGGTETLLIVEDEPLVRQLAANVLREQGYTVLEATDGEAALEVAREHSGEGIGLMMCSVRMPQMDGVEMRLKFGAICPDTRIMMMSGYTRDYAVGKDLLGRDVAFLAKPFTSEALVLKVRDVLDEDQVTPRT